MFGDDSQFNSIFNGGGIQGGLESGGFGGGGGGGGGSRIPGFDELLKLVGLENAQAVGQGIIGNLSFLRGLGACSLANVLNFITVSLSSLGNPMNLFSGKIPGIISTKSGKGGRGG